MHLMDVTFSGNLKKLIRHHSSPQKSFSFRFDKVVNKIFRVVFFGFCSISTTINSLCILELTNSLCNKFRYGQKCKCIVEYRSKLLISKRRVEYVGYAKVLWWFAAPAIRFSLKRFSMMKNKKSLHKGRTLWCCNSKGNLIILKWENAMVSNYNFYCSNSNSKLFISAQKFSVPSIRFEKHVPHPSKFVSKFLKFLHSFDIFHSTLPSLELCWTTENILLLTFSVVGFFFSVKSSNYMSGRLEFRYKKLHRLICIKYLPTPLNLTHPMAFIPLEFTFSSELIYHAMFKQFSTSVVTDRKCLLGTLLYGAWNTRWWNDVPGE